MIKCELCEKKIEIYEGVVYIDKDYKFIRTCQECFDKKQEKILNRIMENYKNE